MRGGFPVGLVLGAFIFGAIAFGLFCSAREQKNRVALVMAVAFGSAAILLLIGACDSRWLFRFGPPLVIGSVITIALTKALELRKKHRR